MLKRKRSSSELCSSPSSTFSSPPHHQSFSLTVSPPGNPFSSRMFDAHAPHLHSRTLKRFRDNRPSEEEVHQRTLNLLFRAQRPQQSPSPSPTSSTDQDAMHIPNAAPAYQAAATMTTQGNMSTHQGGLHRFWNIHSAPSSAGGLSTTTTTTTTQATQCEDCGSGLGGGDGGMDLDEGCVYGSEGAGTACVACGKTVCFSCSVSNLGEEKRCLACAGRNAWA